METRHESVLMEEVLEQLDIQPSDVVVDGTLGGAGHFSAMLHKLGPAGTIIGFDADHDAIVRAEAVRDAVQCAAQNEPAPVAPAIHLS